MTEQGEEHKRTWTEEFEVAGTELIGRIKSLVAEGNVRQLKIKAPGGEAKKPTAGKAKASRAKPKRAAAGGRGRAKPVARR